MAWTSKVTAVQKNQGQIKVAVEYTNGTEIFGETFTSSSNVDMTWLRQQVISRINAANQNYTFADSLTINQAIDITPIVPNPPVQADIDFANFSRWMQLTVAINAAKQLGWITGLEQVVVDAKNKVLPLATGNIPKMFL